ncbi:MAG TPA: hypothetical protein VKI17_10095, partial [Gemmataceae bacterium]|nr:hypothetical protein [Gemmataceae bacterium]
TQNWYKDLIRSLRSEREADDSRLWYLLATKNAAKLESRAKDKEEEAGEKRLKFLGQVLADAQKPAVDREEVRVRRFRLRALAHLYRNDEDAKVKELAQKADELVQKLAAQEPPPDPPGPRSP